MPWNDDHTKEAKNEIHRLLWEIIGAKSAKAMPTRRWILGSIQYPALIIQLLRVRFPSSEPDVCLPNCIECDMKDFIKYTSSSTYVISSNHTKSIPSINVKMKGRTERGWDDFLRKQRETCEDIWPCLYTYFLIEKKHCFFFLSSNVIFIPGTSIHGQRDIIHFQSSPVYLETKNIDRIRIFDSFVKNKIFDFFDKTASS